MTDTTIRSRAGLVVLVLGAVCTFLGMLVLTDPLAPAALLAAVVLLAAGTLLYGTSVPQSPRPPTR